LVVGLGAPDDAAVWRLDERRALVVTTDFFTPIVDDPYDYGAIAAANALSDLYAMGAAPIFALNVAALPPDLPPEVLDAIFRGGAEKVREAGAVIAGGHSVQDSEPKFGLVAVGLADVDRLLVKSGLRPGDLLVLSKPLGTGVTATALKQARADPADVAEAVGWMKRLNAAAGRLALEFGAGAATDVTGFGLLGHSSEMAQASRVRLVFHAGAFPWMRGAARYAAEGFIAGGSRDNRAHFGPAVSFASDVDETTRWLLFDAQTSGGLLFGVDPQHLPELLAAAVLAGVDLWPVGRAETGSGIHVEAGPWPKERYPKPSSA
jgi:selenide,water dikinase